MFWAVVAKSILDTLPGIILIWKRLQLSCSLNYLVLNINHIVEINGIMSICLAHGINKGILKHDYFGTNKVINDMQQMPGWDNGRVIVNEGCIVRDPDTNLVVGMIYNN